jgi:uncharacterized protein YjbI with pentapeptide repeats
LSKSIVTRTDFTGSNLTRADLLDAVGDATTRFNETVTRHTKWGRDASGGSVR